MSRTDSASTMLQLWYQLLMPQMMMNSMGICNNVLNTIIIQPIILSIIFSICDPLYIYDPQHPINILIISTILKNMQLVISNPMCISLFVYSNCYTVRYDSISYTLYNIIDLLNYANMFVQMINDAVCSIYRMRIKMQINQDIEKLRMRPNVKRIIWR